MSVATARVSMATVPWGDDKIELPLVAPGGANVTYYPGTMVCRDASGNANTAADTAGFSFVGINAESVNIVSLAGEAAGARTMRTERPWRFAMNIASAAAGDEGKKLYVVDNQTVGYSSSNAILVGFVDQVLSSTVVLVNPLYAPLNPVAVSNNVLAFSGTTGVNQITFPAAEANALALVQGTNTYMQFVTTAGSEQTQVLSPAATAATNAGGSVAITAGAGGATSGAGGAVLITSGAGTAGNAVGGALTMAAGASQGTNATGAVASMVGGASGAGATGNGGIAKIVGGAALSTNGTGGAAQVTGGVATGTGVGGAVTITSGASGGASGTAGAVTIDAGAASGGTAGQINIAPTNTTTTTFGNTTNPCLKVVSGTAGTGLSITSAAANSGLAIAVISSQSNENLTENAKGSGTITIGGVSTGLISIGRGSTNVIIESSTKATLSSGTSVTASAANLLGGYVIVSGQTSATTLTTDTGNALDSAIASVTTGDCFFVTVYNANTSSGAVTLAAGSNVTLKGTTSLPISKAATLFFQRTGTNTWDCVATVSA